MRWQHNIRLCCLGVALLFGLILVNSARAQQTISSATLSGRVEDAAGAVVKGASVTVRNVETNLKHTCTCDEEGLFRFPYLAVGRYAVDVEAPGFADLKLKVSRQPTGKFLSTEHHFSCDSADLTTHYPMR